ncbi:MAG: nucleotidyltransferase family protein [Blastocatellia bacterium]
MKALTSFLKQNPKEGSTRARGRLVAQLLSGAWRASPTPPTSSAQELEDVAALLPSSGAGGLAWCKIRHSVLGTSPTAFQLQQAYRLHSLQAALHRRSLKQVIPLLRSFGVEPVLVKGWAIARVYPELGMRPYGDLDLCVLPEQYAHAKAVLKSREIPDADLHLGFGKFYDRQTNDIFGRSQLVGLDDLEVRVLSAEDHLRFLCMHLLRHGAVRPLWLCDIAVLLETRAQDFDWDRCLGHSRQQADWVACAIGLAHELLGTEVEGTPIARRAKKLPSWLVPAVLKEWGTPFQSLRQVTVYLKRPLRALSAPLRELSSHWPNAIEATITLKGPFNELPRLPFQVGHVFSRTTALLLQLSRLSGASSS